MKSTHLSMNIKKILKKGITVEENSLNGQNGIRFDISEINFVK